MDLDQFPLSVFEVDCDGSACGSRSSVHIHLPQDGCPALARVVVRGNRRVRYEHPGGVTRLVAHA